MSEQAQTTLHFTAADKRAIDEFFVENPPDEEAPKLSPLATFEELQAFVAPEIWAVIGKLRQVDPTQFGFKGERMPFEDTPNNLVTIKDTGYFDFITHEWQKMGPKYLPQPVFEALTSMKQAFDATQPVPAANTPGRTLIVLSGYRPPAIQMLTMLRWLRYHNYDTQKVFKQVALPEYSQHCSASHTAIDFVTIDGKPDESDLDGFVDTPEYKWLQQNAGKFGFAESYPKDNPHGIRWEPWHWQYLPT